MDNETLILILRIASGVLLLIGFIGWMLYLRNSGAILATKSQLSKGVKKRERERLRRQRTEALEEFSVKKKGFARILEKDIKRYVYSGLDRKLKKIGYLWWVVIKAAITLMTTILTTVISKNILIGLLFGCVAIAGFFIYENILVLRNHQSIDRELVKMMNLIGAFSETNGKISVIFGDIAEYLEDPLRSMLQECSYDARISGDENLAMAIMTAKTDHAKFKETVKNLQICLSYSPNFKNVIDSTKESLLMEQKLKRERESLARDSTINIVLVSVLLVFALGISTKISDGMSVVQLLFNTTAGIIVMIVWAVAYAVFIMAIINTRK